MPNPETQPPATPEAAITAQPADSDAEAPVGPDERARAQAMVRRFGLLLVGSAVLFAVGGAIWGGVDFAAAVLIGSGVVILNFWWTKRLVQSVVFDSKPKALLTLSYLIKLGLSAWVLYLTIVTVALPSLGVVLGISCLVPAVAIFAIQGPAATQD